MISVDCVDLHDFVADYGRLAVLSRVRSRIDVFDLRSGKLLYSAQPHCSKPKPRVKAKWLVARSPTLCLTDNERELLVLRRRKRGGRWLLHIQRLLDGKPDGHVIREDHGKLLTVHGGFAVASNGTVRIYSSSSQRQSGESIAWQQQEPLMFRQTGAASVVAVEPSRRSLAFSAEHGELSVRNLHGELLLSRSHLPAQQYARFVSDSGWAVFGSTVFVLPVGSTTQ